MMQARSKRDAFLRFVWITIILLINQNTDNQHIPFTKLDHFVANMIHSQEYIWADLSGLFQMRLILLR
jgi:hypothetical protein